MSAQLVKIMSIKISRAKDTDKSAVKEQIGELYSYDLITTDEFKDLMAQFNKKFPE